MWFGLTCPWFITLNKVGITSIDWQLLEYPEIYSFLITTHRWSFTRASMCTITTQVIGLSFYCPCTYLMTARVKHSQKLSATPVKKPWVAAENGSVCPLHIHGWLRWSSPVHYWSKYPGEKNMACTSLPYSWLPPSFQSVPFAQLADIDFSIYL